MPITLFLNVPRAMSKGYASMCKYDCAISNRKNLDSLIAARRNPNCWSQASVKRLMQLLIELFLCCVPGSHKRASHESLPFEKFEDSAAGAKRPTPQIVLKLMPVWRAEIWT